MDLKAVAKRLMLENGFEPDMPAAVPAQLAQLQRNPPRIAPTGDVKDLRHLLWSSIDNDTSRDLDQLEVAESVGDGATKIMVAIADVDAYVAKATPIDAHAATETTTVYTGVSIFPMLPEPLSTDATSLNEDGDRFAMVIEFVVSPDGHVTSSAVYRAVVRNTAQLTYNAVGAWLERRGPAPAKVAASAPLEAQLRMQDAAAQALRLERYRHGALNIETIETRPVISHGEITSVEKQDKNRATELIEDFMIASNEVVARTLGPVSSIRRIVRTPKRWDRIVALAATMGTTLPTVADSRALNEFLIARKAADPDHFADLSLAVIKLMGPGEYVLERPGDPEQGHFGLAVEDYTHSTAPNRRFADLVTQRLLKAWLSKQPPPYTDGELNGVARDCTLKADASRKVEREMSKRIAAVAMSGRVGESFDAIVTGAGPKGTFVRVLRPHIEGMLVSGQHGADVGDRLRVTLVHTNADKGFIDFARN
ncbi:MAG: RNB domain-containing ribonuclease [Acidobacteriota bacterium]